MISEDTIKEYDRFEDSVKKGICPICSSALRIFYCPTHGMLKSGIGTLIDSKMYDTKLLELANGCK